MVDLREERWSEVCMYVCVCVLVDISTYGSATLNTAVLGCLSSYTIQRGRRETTHKIEDTEHNIYK